jgi:spermidine/putrescine transport system substrate-binding protein
MRLRLLGWAAAAALTLGGPAAWADGELHIYNWGDYTNPKLIEKFEQKYNVKVTIDDYDSNETMLAKVRAGSSGYDIVVPTDYTVKIMVDEGLLAKTEPNKMENFKNVDPQWVDVYWDPGRNYSVPWQWGTSAFAVDTAVYKGDIDTLDLLFHPPAELQGKINMQPDLNMTINMALRYLGKPRCTGAPDEKPNAENLKAVNELLTQAKPAWRTIDYGMIDQMVSGDAAASAGWNGAAMRVREQKATVKYAYPKEGFDGWMDNVVVLSDAPNLENAKLFQNFIMDPENAALISDFAKYANGIAGSDKFMPAEFATAPEIKLPEGAAKPEFVPPCSKDVNDMYNKIWTNLLK